MNQTLGLILQRVDRLQTAIADVCLGVANIVGEMKVMAGLVRENVVVRTPVTSNRNQHPHQHVPTSNLPEWQQCHSQTNVADMLDAEATPTCTKKQQPVQQSKGPGAEASRPIVVDLENTSTHLGDENESCELRTPTPGTHGKRIHSQPRLRAVPCTKRLEGVEATASIDDDSADDFPMRRQGDRMYRNPPGYENARDFGASEEAFYKPPLLQPKTHGVSAHPPPRHEN